MLNHTIFKWEEFKVGFCLLLVHQGIGLCQCVAFLRLWKGLKLSLYIKAHVTKEGKNELR